VEGLVVGLVCFTTFLAGLAALAVPVLRALRPAQRAVACLGAWAAVAQVYYPPCVVDLDPPFPIDPPFARTVAVGRRPLLGELSYHPSAYEPYIDAARLAAGLVVTAGATGLACWLAGRIPRAAPVVPPGRTGPS
jgi:hypothetical protein